MFHYIKSEVHAPGGHIFASNFNMNFIESDLTWNLSATNKTKYMSSRCMYFAFNVMKHSVKLKRQTKLNNPYKKITIIGLVWFYSISTIVNYLMSNPLYTYIYIYIKQYDL